MAAHPSDRRDADAGSITAYSRSTTRFDDDHRTTRTATIAWTMNRSFDEHGDDEQRAHAVEVEELLGDDGAADQRAELDADGW